jgi:hypothetical protein
VFGDFDRFLQKHYPLKPLLTLTFDAVTRRMAGEFIAWRAAQVSPSAVKREFSEAVNLLPFARLIRFGRSDRVFVTGFGLE